MRVALTLPPDTELSHVAQLAQQAEAWGVDTLHIPEMTHDSLMVATLAVAATQRITIRTSMTLAFPRSPMIVAYAAWDLARFSKGRFELGLASQVRGNIVGRFGIEWSDDVAARLGDYAETVRDIFTAFTTGNGIDHRGSHYTITRLQPAFTPAPLDVDAPRICMGAVGPVMAATAGRVADRLVTHATNTHPQYLRQVLLPALRRGADQAQRPMPGITVVPMCITAPDEAGLVVDRQRARQQLGFLYSTPRYQRTLEMLGIDVGPQLSTMAQRGEWDCLADVLSDDVIRRITPEATWADLPTVLHQWYGDLADEVALGWPTDPDFADLVAAIQTPLDPT